MVSIGMCIGWLLLGFVYLGYLYNLYRLVTNLYRLATTGICIGWLHWDLYSLVTMVLYRLVTIGICIGFYFFPAIAHPTCVSLCIESRNLFSQRI